MQEKEYKLPNGEGSLYYEKKGNTIMISRFQGFAREIVIPSYIEECPVKVITKKAFLSKKTLQKVVLQEELEELGDWAFAYCDKLEEVVLPDKIMQIGRALFLECNCLKRVYFQSISKEKKKEQEEQKEYTKRIQLSYLLAAAFTVFEAYYFLDTKSIGSREWIAKWDNRMLDFLHREDKEGYAKQVLCGEEDYGSTDLEAFLNQKRKRKVRLLYLRLLNPYGLPENIKEELEQYLLAHTSGCDSEEAWEVILEEYGNNPEYYQLFAEIGCLKEENFNKILQDIGEKYPEMKVYFIRQKEEKIGYTDFFANLLLD